MKGGYQILDLKKEAFTSGTGKKVSGSRKILAGANGKRTIVENLMVGETAYSAFDISFPPISSTAVATAKGMSGSSNVTISVASDDTVTVTVS